MNYLNIILEHLGLVSVLVGLVIYSFTHQAVAISYAKSLSLKLMLSVEANAEQYLLTSGIEKFEYVILNGYPKLPHWTRVFVSKTQFEELVQNLFDTAKDYAQKHRRV